MDIWNNDIYWFFDTGHTSGYTWYKVPMFKKYDKDDKTVDSLDYLYFKYQKCISGVTYQYVLDLYDIYNRSVMTCNDHYNEFMYNEDDIINNYMQNFNYVDLYSVENIDTGSKITNLNGYDLKSDHRLILVGQNDKTENGIYKFDINGNMIKTDDLDTSGKSYRYGVNVILDNDKNVEFFLKNSGSTFPLTDEQKSFTTGHTFIIKNTFGYNINSTGTTPMLWFTDYDFARKMNSKNSELYSDIVVNNPPTSNIKIFYKTGHTEFEGNFGQLASHDGPFTWNQDSGKTHLNISMIYNFPSNVNVGDYLYIEMSGIISGQTNYVIFNSTVYTMYSGCVVLDEYVPDYVLSGMTDIHIENLNRVDNSNWSATFDRINRHYMAKFFTISGSTFPITIVPKYNEYNRYIDYDSFLFDFGSSTYRFTSDNYYIDYKLYEHLNSINSSIFNSSFDLGSGFTMTNFSQYQTYLVDDISYPATTSNMYSPLKIVPDDPSDLIYFYENTAVYTDGDYNSRVFILKKDNDSITIERPFNLSPGTTVSSITSFYSLSGISEVLYDVYLNDVNDPNYYYKDYNYIRKICKAYSDILSSDIRIISNTTGTIYNGVDDVFTLRLFNNRSPVITELTGNTINGVYYENDINLTLKPSEILDVGTDKLTKMPLTIKDDNIIISDTSSSGHTVDIVMKSLDNNITLVDGLTIERLKIRYNWIFNATIDNAIIGEDENGLVWYTGNWYCGDWINGTWYSGTFYDGRWFNGKWYSWLIDKYSILVNDKLKNLDDNKIYSNFVNGVWKNGNWYNGIFGRDISISGYTSKQFLSHTDILPDDLNVATWENGIFHKGEFKNSIWEDGLFMTGEMYGGYWKNGTFSSGTFDGNWWNGNFYGGDFISGIWENGIFTNSNGDVRFGYNSIDTSSTTTEWWDGTASYADIYSGVGLDVNHNRTHWYNGTIRNSKWYGGHFFVGNFYSSYFYNGVFGHDGTLVSGSTTFYSGDFENGLWIDGTFVNGNFKNGIWLNGDFYKGNIKTNNPDNYDQQRQSVKVEIQNKEYRNLL